MADILDAEARLLRFAPLLEKLFNDLKESHGIIESDIVEVNDLYENMSKIYGIPLKGKLWVKADHALPVAGSIKARGGIYEVLYFAEKLALENGLIKFEDNYSRLLTDSARRLFKKFTITVASTGNLGLSVGTMGAALGFLTTVHMSAEAKEWKKERLRKRGVKVIEHKSDYSAAVKEGRKEAESDPSIYFVDDENSKQLFLGYSVAALRLKKQLEKKNVTVDTEHPLFVYLPCGVGGAPGAITFGLKHVFGDAVHCFTAEPVDSPCLLLAMLSEFMQHPTVYEIGLTNKTEADGLAVSTVSVFAGKIIKNLLSGAFTVEDDSLFKFLYQLDILQGMCIEPSAAAGFAGPGFILKSHSGKEYLEKNNLVASMDNANHVLWTTGGLFVPPEEYDKFRKRGEKLSQLELRY
jgi:D-serine dehydratase